MDFIKKNMARHSLVIMAFALWLSACSNSTMHDPYKEFIEGGEITYVGMPNDINVYPGHNRLALSWLQKDPTASKAMIYWHNRTDSLEVPINRAQGADTVNVMLTDLQEGQYSFDIFIHDEDGNTSVRESAHGFVYGDNYINSLLPRLISNAEFDEGTLTIDWVNVTDETLLFSEFTYTDVLGSEQTLSISREEQTTILDDFDFDVSNVIEYRSLYVPDSMAIDTFYTAFEESRVWGPPVEIGGKENWTAEASDWDARPAHGDNRMPFRAIDGDEGTHWINAVGESSYPHWITIDMDGMIDEIAGISIFVNDRAETPSEIDIAVSDDGDNWSTMGVYSMARATGWQYFDFMEPQDAAYFRVTANAGHGSSNIVIYEISAYRR